MCLPWCLSNPPTAGFEHSQARGSFQSLVAVLHATATARGQPAVLSPAELAAYSQALSSHRVADRMALAAELVGEEAEAAFWRRLPATLQWLTSALQQARRRRPVGGAAAAGGMGGGSGPGSGTLPPLARTSSTAAPPSSGGTSSSGTSSSSTRGRLWDERLELAEAVERSGWHEQMSRRIFEDSEGLQVGGVGWQGSAR